MNRTPRSASRRASRQLAANVPGLRESGPYNSNVSSVSFETSPLAGLEHHLWMLDGSLTLEVEGSPFWLRAGDCLRYVLAGPTRFKNPGKREARYLVAMVRP